MLARAEQQGHPVRDAGDAGPAPGPGFRADFVPRIPQELLDQVLSQGLRCSVFLQPLRVPANRFAYLSVRILAQIQLETHPRLVVCKKTAPGQVAAPDDVTEAALPSMMYSFGWKVPDASSCRTVGSSKSLIAA